MPLNNGKMITAFKKHPKENFLVQSVGKSFPTPVHTTIKGRARYKINKLYHSQSFKTYLEDKLSQQEGITKVQANPLTGNILIKFHPTLSHDRLALILNDIVFNYKKPLQFLPSTVAEGNGVTALSPTTNGSNKKASILLIKMLLNKQLEQANNQVRLVWGTVTILTVLAGLLYVRGLDTAILLLIENIHTPILNRIMLGLTFLGDPIVLSLISLGLIISPVKGFNSSQKATILGVATFGGIGLNYWLKVMFGRVRPALWDRLINVGHHSFPSGHAMMSIITYGLIAYLLSKQYPQWRGRIFASSLILIGGIGLSRLYLGVHWPTDVIAGYAVGLLWLSACIFAWELWEQYKLNSNEKLLTSYQLSSSP